MLDLVLNGVAGLDEDNRGGMSESGERPFDIETRRCLRPPTNEPPWIQDFETSPFPLHEVLSQFSCFQDEVLLWQCMKRCRSSPTRLTRAAECVRQKSFQLLTLGWQVRESQLRCPLALWPLRLPQRESLFDPDRPSGVLSHCHLQRPSFLVIWVSARRLRDWFFEIGLNLNPFLNSWTLVLFYSFTLVLYYSITLSGEQIATLTNSKTSTTFKKPKTFQTGNNFEIRKIK